MAEINVTPLVDVMLVLLIIFMVTAPLLVAGVPITLPDSRAKALDQADKPVQLSMDATGALFLDDAQISREDLPQHLAEIAATGGVEGPQIFLRADRGLDYGEVMAVMGEVNRAGLKRVALVTTEGTAKDVGR
jgi:biopolymer transport protein TolR